MQAPTSQPIIVLMLTHNSAFHSSPLLFAPSEEQDVFAVASEDSPIGRVPRLERRNIIPVASLPSRLGGLLICRVAKYACAVLSWIVSWGWRRGINEYKIQGYHHSFI